MIILKKTLKHYFADFYLPDFLLPLYLNEHNFNLETNMHTPITSIEIQ